MGFDMFWKIKEDGEDEAIAMADLLVEEAARERNSLPEHERGRLNREKFAQVQDLDAHEVYDGRTDRYRAAQDKVLAKYSANRSHFRLNIGGMSVMLHAMELVGMVFDDDPPYPPFPQAEDYGITDEQATVVEYGAHQDLASEVVDRVRAYTAALDTVLTWHGRADTLGVPAHKFSSNDGWHVLPVECQAAVHIYREWRENHEQGLGELLSAAGLGANPQLWFDWVGYLDGAARHGGFEVC